MEHNTSAGVSPPGPSEKNDLHIAAGSFPVIEDLLRRYPDICAVPAASRKSDACLVNHPDLIKRVLIDNHRNYLKGPGFERVKMLLGNGIIVSDGETWKRQRRMVQPAFHRDMLRNLSEMIQKESLRLLVELETAAREGRTVELGRTMSGFALEVILKAIFGDDLESLADGTGTSPFSIFMDHGGRDLNLAVKFRALIGAMREVISRRREEEDECADMLGAMMAARDLEGRPMDERALIDEIMTLIVAGHETSAITLTWMWYLIGLNPPVERCLHAEVDGLPGPAGSAPGYEQAITLEYCRQVMHESLRLYPPVWLFSRKALSDDRLGDYAIPAGTDIFIAPYFLHRRPDFWPEPAAFDPGRFSEPAVQGRHRLAFIPFSAGPRKCIGDVFAALEIQIHMGTIARRLKMLPADSAFPELEPAINLRNRDPIIVYPELRRPT